MTSGEIVLVTGGSGFVAGHCIIALLRQNYRVRTTLRSLKRCDEVRDKLKAGGATEQQVKGVEFVAAELMRDNGWVEACQGCSYVLHVASPYGVTKIADELILPAREGTLRALRAAKKAGTVKRVVITSSISAIIHGHPQREDPFTEEDWTVVDSPDVPVYHKSKTVAERAAWDWMEDEGESMELAVVNPVSVLGPILGKDYAPSIELVVRLLNGQMPGVPKVQMGIVDVRDVADLHIKAMKDPKAAGQRFLAVCDEPFLTFQDIARRLKQQLGEKAEKVPTRTIPNFLMKLLGYVDANVAMIVPELGKYQNATNKKAKSTLDWQPRSANEVLRSTAESLSQFGLTK